MQSSPITSSSYKSFPDQQVGLLTHDHIKAVADYYQTIGARELAHKVKDFDLIAMVTMAKYMAKLVLPSDVLIPVPSRNGIADQTLVIALEISRITGAKVANILRGKPRTKSLYEIKVTGGDANTVDFGFRSVASTPDNAVLVDTVCDTGTTLLNAKEALGEAKAIVHSIVTVY